jgi:3-oxoacyl-[acyl-carrier protein] reductase
VVIDDLAVGADGVPAAEAVAAEIIRSGGRALACREDVTTASGAQAMVDAAVAEFGRLDILFNCAGNVVKSDLVDLTERQWDSVIDLHLKGHFLACQAATRVMLENGWGRIVNVGSRGAFWDVPDNKLEPRTDPRRPSSAAYAAAKAGIMALSTTLAIELWDTGITVNCLLPSANTALFPGTKPNPVGGIPPASSMEPEFIAPLIVYLASDLSEQVSGRFFYASGGDICLYTQPFQLPGGGSIVRTPGVWEPEEIASVLSGMLGVPAP